MNPEKLYNRVLIRNIITFTIGYVQFKTNLDPKEQIDAEEILRLFESKYDILASESNNLGF